MKVKADLSKQIIFTPVSFSSNQLNASGDIVNDIKVSNVSEHDLLLHRDFADQHPISSITNLENALESRPSDVITNMDIHEILSH